MLEIYYNFFKKVCDTVKYEELESDTDSLYSSLFEEKLEDVLFPENKLNGTSYVLKNALTTFFANATGNFFLRNCSDAHKKKHDKREPGLSKEEF